MEYFRFIDVLPTVGLEEFSLVLYCLDAQFYYSVSVFKVFLEVFDVSIIKRLFLCKALFCCSVLFFLFLMYYFT